MKYLCLLFFLLTLVGCQQLVQGQQQPVKELKENIYLTSCGGMVETWGSCSMKAKDLCGKGYIALSQVENSTGTKRELTFQCNK